MAVLNFVVAVHGRDCRANPPLKLLLVLSQSLFECLEFFTRSRQDGFLHLEFLAAYEIKFAEPGIKDGAKILLQVLLHRPQALGNCLSEFSRQVLYRIITHCGLIPQGRSKNQSRIGASPLDSPGASPDRCNRSRSTHLIGARPYSENR